MEYMKRPSFENSSIVIALLFIALAFIAGFETALQTQPPQVITRNYSEHPVKTSSSTQLTQAAIEPLANVSLLLPAVDEEKKGASAVLYVERRNGTGRVFLNLDESRPYIANETQASLKNAVRIARTFDKTTGQRFARSDLLYSFKANSQEVGGSSAGAALAVATIALLHGKQLNFSIAITGAVNENGGIEKVGAILEKARVLKEAGVTTFLVPLGESTQEVTTAMEREECSEQIINGGVFVNCVTRRELDTHIINITNETGINVIETPDVRAAYQIMST